MNPLVIFVVGADTGLVLNWAAGALGHYLDRRDLGRALPGSFRAAAHANLEVAEKGTVDRRGPFVAPQAADQPIQPRRGSHDGVTTRLASGLPRPGGVR